MEDPSRTNPESRRASKAPWQSEEYFKAIIQNSSDIVLVLDKLGTITYASPSVERFLGYGSDELIGKSSLDLIASDDKPRAMADFGRALLIKEILIPNVFRMKHKNGTERIFEGVGNNLLDDPIVAGFVMNVRDITDRKRVEEALRGSQAFYHSLVEQLPAGVFRKDREGRFVFVSPWFCRLKGMKEEEFLGKTPLEVLASEAEKPVASDQGTKYAVKGADHHVQIMQNGNPVELVEEYTDAAGRKQFVHAIKIPVFNPEGEVIGTQGILFDITEGKRTEQQLRESLEQLRRAVETTIQVLVMAVEIKDPYTAGHQRRMTNLARTMATEMGLPPEKIEGLRMAGVIHDIGKITLPTEILSKPTKLSAIELSLIREHVRLGYDILKDVESPWPLAEIVLQHHERMDGSGYPRGFKGEEILIEARILAVADVVESMASHRPYRPARGLDAALEEIEKNRGILYDEAVVDVCMRVFRDKGYQFEGA